MILFLHPNIWDFIVAQVTRHPRPAADWLQFKKLQTWNCCFQAISCQRLGVVAQWSWTARSALMRRETLQMIRRNAFGDPWKSRELLFFQEKTQEAKNMGYLTYRVTQATLGKCLGFTTTHEKPSPFAGGKNVQGKPWGTASKIGRYLHEKMPSCLSLMVPPIFAVHCLLDTGLGYFKFHPTLWDTEAGFTQLTGFTMTALSLSQWNNHLSQKLNDKLTQNHSINPNATEVDQVHRVEVGLGRFLVRVEFMEFDGSNSMKFLILWSQAVNCYKKLGPYYIHQPLRTTFASVLGSMKSAQKWTNSSPWAW